MRRTLLCPDPLRSRQYPTTGSGAAYLYLKPATKQGNLPPKTFPKSATTQSLCWHLTRQLHNDDPSLHCAKLLWPPNPNFKEKYLCSHVETLAGCSKKLKNKEHVCKLCFFTFCSKLQVECMVVHVLTHTFFPNTYIYLKLAFFFWFSRSKNQFDPLLHHLYLLSLRAHQDF